MPEKISSASFDFSVRPGSQPRTEAARSAPKRFNVVVLGDFTDRTHRGVTEPLESRKLIAVDCDNFERVFAQLAPKIRLSDGASSLELEFQSLDDFHPDRLLARTASLTKLLEARRLLLNPSTAAQGKTLLEAYLGSAIGGPADAASPGPAKAESDDQTMARLLGGAPPASAVPATGKSNVEQLIRKLVAPHVAPAAAPGQQSALAAADLELAKKLRTLLHQPDFQSLEATWRGTDFLIRRIEAVDDIGVLLLDLSLAELDAGLFAEPGGTPPLLRLLRERKIAFIAANFVFGRTGADLQTLGKMARLAAQLDAPFIATADPRLAGCDSFGLHPDPDDWTTPLAADADAAWQALRKMSESDHVSLAAPRFLLRQPYGKSGDAIDSFPFEELAGEPAHEDFLWGHPAMLCASLLVDAFQSQLDDEEAEAPAGGEVGDLPMHKFTSGGETVIKPYAEAWLSERAAVRLANSGIMPLLSRKDYNSIQIPDLYSVSSPPRRLAVRWR